MEDLREPVMGDVIFARPRWNYDSYRDMYRIIELSGYQLIFIDEVDWSRPITVIGVPHNGEWVNIPRSKQTRLIQWNIERPAPSTDYRPGGADVPEGVDEVWVSDYALAKATGAKYVFLGGHQAFGSTDFRHKEWDTITLMANFGRRTGLFAELRNLKNADCEGGTWGDERHMRLQRSRLMVSCHQDDYKWCEPPRFMIAGCYALPLVSEYCENSGYWIEGEHYLGSDLADMTMTVRVLLRDEVHMAHLAANAWRLCCVDRTFRKEVQAAL